MRNPAQQPASRNGKSAIPLRTQADICCDIRYDLTHVPNRLERRSYFDLAKAYGVSERSVNAIWGRQHEPDLAAEIAVVTQERASAFRRKEA